MKGGEKQLYCITFGFGTKFSLSQYMSDDMKSNKKVMNSRVDSERVEHELITTAINNEDIKQHSGSVVNVEQETKLKSYREWKCGACYKPLLVIESLSVLAVCGHIFHTCCVEVPLTDGEKDLRPGHGVRSFPTISSCPTCGSDIHCRPRKRGRLRVPITHLYGLQTIKGEGMALTYSHKPEDIDYLGVPYYERASDGSGRVELQFRNPELQNARQQVDDVESEFKAMKALEPIIDDKTKQLMRLKSELSELNVNKHTQKQQCDRVKNMIESLDAEILRFQEGIAQDEFVVMETEIAQLQQKYERMSKEMEQNAKRISEYSQHIRDSQTRGDRNWQNIKRPKFMNQEQIENEAFQVWTSVPKPSGARRAEFPMRSSIAALKPPEPRVIPQASARKKATSAVASTNTLDRWLIKGPTKTDW